MSETTQDLVDRVMDTLGQIKTVLEAVSADSYVSTENGDICPYCQAEDTEYRMNPEHDKDCIVLEARELLK